MSDLPTIAFAGIGLMGLPMCRRLLAAGYRLVVWNRSSAKCQPLVDLGARAVATPAELCAEADVVLLCLADTAAVREVLFGKGGVAEGGKAGKLLVDHSSLEPTATRDMAAELEFRCGMRWVDAPVSGGTGGAAAGTLTFMVGGSVSVFDQALPILSAMGKNVVHCGSAGNGQVAKIANNMLLGISMVGVAEAMALGVALGMDAKVLAGIINTSSGRCWSSELYNPFPGVLDNVPAARGYSGGFGSDLMLKDLGLATDAARHARQPVPLGATAQQLYQTFSLQGHGGLDFSAIINLFRREA